MAAGDFHSEKEENEEEEEEEGIYGTGEGRFGGRRQKVSATKRYFGRGSMGHISLDPPLDRSKDDKKVFLLFFNKNCVCCNI